GKRISTIGGAMLSRENGQHDFITGQNGGNRQYSARQGFAQYQDIGLYLFPVTGKSFSGSAYTCLHFIGYEQDVVLVAQFSHPGQIAVRRNNYPSLSLYGFDHKACDMGIVFQGILEGVQI